MKKYILLVLAVFSLSNVWCMKKSVKAETTIRKFRCLQGTETEVEVPYGLIYSCKTLKDLVADSETKDADVLPLMVSPILIKCPNPIEYPSASG